MATYTANQIASVAAGAGFSGQHLVEAVAIALAESSGRTDAVNAYGNTGLWQMGAKGTPNDCGLGYTEAQLKDPTTNAAAAYQLSQGGSSWADWSTWPGAAQQYMATAAAAVQSPSDPGSVTPVSDTTSSGGGIGSVFSMPTQIVDAFSRMTDPHTWLRAGYVVVGGALVIAGLMAVAKPLAAGPARAAATAAAAG